MNKMHSISKWFLIITIGLSFHISFSMDRLWNLGLQLFQSRYASHASIITLSLVFFGVNKIISNRKLKAIIEENGRAIQSAREEARQYAQKNHDEILKNREESNKNISNLKDSIHTRFDMFETTIGELEEKINGFDVRFNRLDTITREGTQALKNEIFSLKNMVASSEQLAELQYLLEEKMAKIELHIRNIREDIQGTLHRNGQGIEALLAAQGLSYQDSAGNSGLFKGMGVLVGCSSSSQV